MSVQVYKNGIVSAGGSGVGENLIQESIFDTEPWLSSIRGTTEIDGKNCYLLSFSTLYSKTSAGASTIFPGITFNENTQYTLTWEWRDDYRTDGKSSSMYIRIKYTDGTYDQRISSSSYTYWKKETMISKSNKTVTAIITTYGNGGTLPIRAFKLELGFHPTPWTPAPSDAIYVGAEHGFIETDGSIAKFYGDFAEANEFIEY